LLHREDAFLSQKIYTVSILFTAHEDNTMLYHHIILTMTTILALTIASATHAVKPHNCGKLPADIVESGRDFRICVTDPGSPKFNCGPTGMDKQEFDNAEGRLPKAGKGTVYYEGKIIQPTDPDAGKKRWVYLSQKVKGKPAVIVAQYYTANHYLTFCQYSK
jgi:ribonuclease T1